MKRKKKKKKAGFSGGRLEVYHGGENHFNMVISNEIMSQVIINIVSSILIR